jgi:hypothetical protein
LNALVVILVEVGSVVVIFTWTVKKLLARAKAQCKNSGHYTFNYIIKFHNVPDLMLESDVQAK